MVSEEQLSRVTGYLEAGVAEGARTVVGGHRAGNRGYIVEPTVLMDAKPDMRVVREEIFGLVVNESRGCATAYE
jgi:acyl-CoA reductase-like NAD-dependent aldehyde dehydrogenase